MRFFFFLFLFSLPFLLLLLLLFFLLYIWVPGGTKKEGCIGTGKDGQSPSTFFLGRERCLIVKVLGSGRHMD